MKQVDTDLIDLIYQAAVEPHRWPDVARKLAQSLGTHQSLIVRSREESIGPEAYVTYGVDTDVVGQFFEILHEDLWLAESAASTGWRECSIYRKVAFAAATNSFHFRTTRRHGFGSWYVYPPR